MTQQPHNAPSPSADDVLMGGGVPAAKFEQERPGTTIGGRIVSPPRTHHERKYDPRNPGQGELKYFPSGDAIYGVTVDVQTDQRDPSVPEDDGVRRLWIEGKRLKQAVRDAVRQVGAPCLQQGGQLYVTFTNLGVAEAGLNPPKEWAAQYVAATPGPVGQDQALGGPPPQQYVQPAQQQAPPQQYAQPAQQPPPQQQQPAPQPQYQQPPPQQQQPAPPAQTAPPAQPAPQQQAPPPPAPGQQQWPEEPPF